MFWVVYGLVALSPIWNGCVSARASVTLGEYSAMAEHIPCVGLISEGLEDAEGMAWEVEVGGVL